METRQSIAALKLLLKQAKEEELTELIRLFSRDEREGVQKLLVSAQKRLRDLEMEKQRMYGLFSFERQYASYSYICGIDEAGRGPFAGPVVAGAVILPKDCDLLYINDSKQLSEKKREELYDQIIEKAVAWGVGYAAPERIDEINILQATYEAMREAVGKLDPQPDFLLNDAVRIPGIDIPQLPIIKGDARSASIGAASIIAKVTRDRLMAEYDKLFPEYGFAANKGYGSVAHIEALRKYGPTPIHRRSFIHSYIVL